MLNQLQLLLQSDFLKVSNLRLNSSDISIKVAHMIPYPSVKCPENIPIHHVQIPNVLSDHAMPYIPNDFSNSCLSNCRSTTSYSISMMPIF